MQARNSVALALTSHYTQRGGVSAGQDREITAEKLTVSGSIEFRQMSIFSERVRAERAHRSR